MSAERPSRLAKLLPYLKLALGVVLIVVISRQLDTALFGRLASDWRGFGIFFAGAFILYLTAFSGTIVRWHLLLLACDVPHRVSDTFRLGFIGLLFSQVVVGATGGDVVKGYYIARETPGHRVAAVYSVVLDRVVGVVGLMLLAAGAFAVNWQTVRGQPVLEQLGRGLIAAFLLLGLAVAVMSWESLWRHPRLAALLEKLPGRRFLTLLGTISRTVRQRPRILGLSVLISIANHGLAVLAHVLLARGMEGVYPDLGTFYFLIPIGMVANALPLSPGGLGVGEFAYRELFRMSGLAHGAELALLMRSCVLLASLIGLVYYLRGRKELASVLERRDEALEEDLPTHTE